MAGHSHFANIKHKKSANDAKKAKVLGKISKEIQIAIKDGSKSPETNPKLRLVLEKARANNIPKDNIERILSKDSKDSTNLFEISYEGYGPNGVAILIDCLTDNVNRTSSEVRSILSKNGGNLGVSGSVSYLFETVGILIIDSSLIDYDKAEIIAIEMDCIDFQQQEDVYVIKTDRKNLIKTKEEYQKNGVNEFLQSEITKIANQKIELNDEQYLKLGKLVDALEDLDDVKDVFHNAD